MDESQFLIQVKCFKMIGIQRDQFVERKKLDKLLSALRLFFMIFCIFSQSLFVVRNCQNISASAEACGPLLTTVLAVAKLLTFTSSKQKFFTMMDKVNLMLVGGKTIGRNFEYFAMIFKFLFIKTDKTKKFKRIQKLDKTIAMAYLFAAFFTGFGYCAIPIITNLYYIISLKQKFNFDMPLKADFFYDITNSPAYELSYLSLCCNSYLVNFISVSF